ncbi:thiamine diphosphokinase [Butyrivibrio fibrisolvens]|uniref:thiamine diphosphokinase n=1 Tax=Butyrivibrio fibrisolvens TaxID=831 RepID=UPI0003B5DA88|nr:thiamine diphosphokinase [Butyrivibrio fibrisolvens]
MDYRDGKCIIVSAGDFEPVDLNIQDEDYLIACDAGFRYLDRMGILPDLIVGDFDSMSSYSEAMNSLREIALEDPDRILGLDVHKDDTDTMKAIKIGFERGYKKFYLYGALGGSRFDHSISNIQALVYIKRHGGKGYIMEPSQIVLIAENETINFNRGMTGILSVFSIGGKAEGVTLKGLEYEMEDGIIGDDFPIGTSNEFIIDEVAQISVRKGTLLLIANWSGAH